jgi:ribosomal protein S18 acetylase RimI-like enzyme
MMQIRRLNSADASVFQRLRLQALRECPSAFSSSYEEEFEIPITAIAGRLAESGRDMFGAFSETELVGTIGFGREGARKLAHKGFIRGMYVSPAFRNQGIGRQLVSHVLQHAASLSGLHQVTLTVTASNVAAIGLYEKWASRHSVSSRQRFSSRVNFTTKFTWCALLNRPKHSV